VRRVGSERATQAQAHAANCADFRAAEGGTAVALPKGSMRPAALLVIFVAACSSSPAGNGMPDGGGGGDGGACPSSVSAAPGLVPTDRGPVQGPQANGTWAWFAIPYAAPPVGALRWQAPQPPACWSAPLATTSFGAACLQLDASDPTQVIGAEDCLTMN